MKTISMQQLKEFLAYYADNHCPKRPFAHFSKKGPGRKHQQGKRN